jgi:hypothetical protein
MALFNSFFSLLSFLLSSSVLAFFYFLPSSILLIISCVINGFLALFSTLPTKSLIESSTNSFKFFHSTSTFQHSHSIAPSFSYRIFCTLCLSPYNFSKSHLGLLFWNFKFFFNLMLNLATSMLWSVSISAAGHVCTSVTLILNRFFTRM